MRVDGPSQPARLLLDVVDRLNSFQIPYAIAGAFAVACYGVPRYTGDGDSVVWMKDTTKTPVELKDDFIASGYRAELRQGDIDDPIALAIRIVDEFKNRVDLLIAVRGMDPDASKRCINAPIMDAMVRVIGAEDLIGMKMFAGGPQDVLDVRGILQVWGERLNPDLLRKVARRYGRDVAGELDKLLLEFPLTS
jgi:hypothetical protein